MEFLKTIFGDKALTFDEMVQAINAHNGDEANEDNQIKVGNLGGGDYVGKGKHDSEVEQLKALLSGKDTDIQSLTETLESLKKSKGDAEAIKKQLDDALKLLDDSKAREADMRLKYAVRDALRTAKAVDVDYLAFKISEKLSGEGKSLELDENEHIKGWDDLLSGLKTQFPTQFEKAGGAGVVIDANPLPTGNPTGTMTRAEFLKKPYAERAAYANENPEAYTEMMKK